MKIARANADRIPDLRPLWEALEVHHGRLAGVPSIRPLADSWERRQERYRDWLADGSGHLYLAEDEGHVVGYLMMTISDPPESWDVGTRAGEIETMSVLPDARSRGVGGALIDTAITEAEKQGVRAIGVGVVHSNVEGIRFYERAGFKPFYVELLRLNPDVRPRDHPRERPRGLRALLRNRARRDRSR